MHHCSCIQEHSEFAAVIKSKKCKKNEKKMSNERARICVVWKSIFLFDRHLLFFAARALQFPPFYESRHNRAGPTAARY